MNERLRPYALALSFVALSAPLACDSDEPKRPGSQGGAAGTSGPVAGAAGAAQGGTNSAGGASAGGASAGGISAGASSAGSAGEASSGAGGADGGGQGAGGARPITDPQVLPTTGDTKDVHDPFIVKDGATYYLFSTGDGVSVRTSPDLLTWKAAGRVFATKPSWITTTADNGTSNHLWAPEVRYFGGKFHLYYSASRFGSNSSCMGHATRTSLSSGAGWVDDGQAVLCSKEAVDDYNAIDPSPFEDESGQLWLAFGSFWSGLKLIRLNSDGRRDGPDLFSLSTRPHPPGAVEAPQLFYQGGFYYLFESVDSCCQGVDSTYKMMVGRSTSVSGPYLDKAGDALLADRAGTLLLEGNDRYRGPGHNAILVDGNRYYNVYHAYDADDAGAPYLRIADLIWGEDGWPITAGP
jgi:arabinan endo-1,5-alpha-L-arabinosidase